MAYTNPGGVVNELLSSITPNTVFRGELVAFHLGKKVPFLARPNVPKSIFRTAIAM